MSDPFKWNPDARALMEQAVAERDRARAIAVALEQQLAAVEKVLSAWDVSLLEQPYTTVNHERALCAKRLRVALGPTP